MASVSGGDRKLKPASCKDGQPELSLSWCLAHLSKPKHQKSESQTLSSGAKRSPMAQWRALVAIRTHHIKGHRSSISRFSRQGGLEPLLGLIRQTDCSRKTLDLALSILGNCCTERETCSEVRKLDGINIVVEVMRKHVALLSIQNRAARVLGNLAMDPENSALIHAAGGVPLLLLCVSQSSSASSPSSTSTSPTTSSPSPPCTPSSASTTSASPTPSSASTPPVESSPGLECAQSAARALFYLSDTPSHRLSLVSQGAVASLCPLVAPELPLALRRTSLRALHELTRGCGVECARQVTRSGALSQLGLAAASGEEEEGRALEELALKTLANLCAQGCLRPLVGSLDVIKKFVEEVKRDALKSGVFLKALCLCCKEAVNRAKVKECGGLELLTGFLASHQSHPLSRFVIQACVDFVFDEAAVEQLQELGLVPLLVERLVRLCKGEEPVCAAGSNLPPPDLLPQGGLDSYDFPPPEEKREQALCSSSFLSLRSWLLSEGLISSEGDLLESSSTAEPDWSGLPLSSPHTANTTTTTTTTTPTPAATSNHKPSPSPKNHPPTSSPGSSPVKTPLSPTKPRLCSPLRRRPRDRPSVLRFPLETPPSVTRPASYHPYHPEPWTPESPILLLLSRFSHVSDPSAALVSCAVISALLLYLTSHGDPSGRCFRMLLRLSVNPNCLQALVRCGSAALIRYHLCDRGEREGEEGEEQSPRVKAKVRQLGLSLLSNLQLQCESGFGAGVLSHLMLSGTESDRLHCALSLPLITSNKTLLRKLLLDNGGLQFALQPLGGDTDSNQTDTTQNQSPDLPLRSLYCPLLVGCLSALNASSKPSYKRHFSSTNIENDQVPPPSPKKPRFDQSCCPYSNAKFNLTFLLDDGVEIPANHAAVSGEETSNGSEYFRALLKGGFGEANSKDAIPIRDVSAGMLTPVLHYLHGCRFANANETTARERCQTLEAIAKAGISRNDHFEQTVLGEAMIGARRFLVADLQKELEEVCVSLLDSEDVFEKGTRETQDENVANQSDFERNAKTQETVSKTPKRKRADSAVAKDELMQENGSCASILDLLPEIYWFSQRYSYEKLGGSCLSVLTGPRFSQSKAGECLRRLAKEADCVDALKKDLVALAARALS